MAQRGFQKRRLVFVTRTPTGDGCYGQAGFNERTRTDDGSLRLLPIVGVVHVGAMKLLGALLDVPAQNLGATVSRSLSGLTEGRAYRDWAFYGDDDDVRLEQMVDTLMRYGLPFMERWSSLEALSDGLQRRCLSDAYFGRMKLPIVYWLMGNRERALQFLEEEEQRIAVQPALDPAEREELERAFQESGLIVESTPRVDHEARRQWELEQFRRYAQRFREEMPRLAPLQGQESG